MKAENLSNKDVLILGFGREGRASLQFLLSRKIVAPERLWLADQRNLEEFSSPDRQLLKGISSQKIHLGKDYLRWPEIVPESGVVIKSPGIKVTPEQRRGLEKRKVKLTTATNIFEANFPGKIIAVTGTKGKSTTASLIEAVLREADYPVYLAGNIGQPALELLTSNQINQISSKTWVVLELSSYQTEDLEEGFSSYIVVILNLYEDHLDYHEGSENYHRAKLKLLSGLKEKAHFIYSSRFPLLQVAAQKVSAPSWDLDQQKLPDKLESVLIGEHNRDNLRAARVVARILKISPEKFKKAVEKFQPLRHRLELVGRFRGIYFYDDAISTTPESTIAAIEALRGTETVFLGGQDRGYDFTQLAQVITNSSIKNVIFFPDSGKRIKSALKKTSPEKWEQFKILETDKMKEAVKFAYQQTSPGKICLLSCASPSYSLWKNFEEKGGEFQKWVYTAVE